MENNSAENVVDLEMERISRDLAIGQAKFLAGLPVSTVPPMAMAIAIATQALIRLMLTMSEQQDIRKMPAGPVLTALAKSLAESLPERRA